MTDVRIGNLFRDLPDSTPEEVFSDLVAGHRFELKRIVSTGQCTPLGEWYDQDTAEWVVLLSGAAVLRFDGDAEPLEIRPGDYVVIPARCRHRVDWTTPDEPTVWLALHYREDVE